MAGTCFACLIFVWDSPTAVERVPRSWNTRAKRGTAAARDSRQGVGLGQASNLERFRTEQCGTQHGPCIDLYSRVGTGTVVFQGSNVQEEHVIDLGIGQ